MNKKTFITMMLALVAMTGQAQEIKMKKGYQAYSFDVSAIKGKILHSGMMRRIR